jgi:hypothetical protein
VVPMPVTGQEPSAAPQQASEAARPTPRPDRADRPDRAEGERTGRRSRRGGRRRRREPGEGPVGAEPPVLGEAQGTGTQDSAAVASTVAPVIPITAVEPRPEWTPTPPSDATREGPRSEP